MNVLFISPNSPYESVGGIERYITNLINYYSDKSNCGIYLLLPTTEISRVEKKGNVTIIFERCFSIPKDASLHRKDISINANRFASIVEDVIKSKHINVICVENIICGPPAVYSLLLNMVATSCQIPIILRLHSFAVTDLQIELANQLMWDKISCVSQSVAGDCFRKGADVDNLSTHYLGVNTLQFNNITNNKKRIKKQLIINDSARILLTATRIIQGKKNILHEKGVINLIKAFSKFSARYSDVYLVIAVANATESLISEFTNTYKMLMDYIKLHGVEKQTIVKTFSLSDMPDVYRASDIFILASENETFGQVFIEAMSSGVPVIGTKVGGIPEIISDSYNGYLVQPDDASALSQRIEKLLNNKYVRESFIKKGVKTVQTNFSGEKQFSDFHKVLEDCVLHKQ